MNILYKTPKFKEDFKELAQFPDMVMYSMSQWLLRAAKGKSVLYSKLFQVDIKQEQNKMQQYFDKLPDDKKNGFADIIKSGLVEMPIVLTVNNQTKILGGKTRLAGLIKDGIDPYVWHVEI